MSAQPTIIELSSASHAHAVRAKMWRKNVAKLTRAELGRRIGYSPGTILNYERGYWSSGKAISEQAWAMFWRACERLDVEPRAGQTYGNVSTKNGVNTKV